MLHNQTCWNLNRSLTLTRMQNSQTLLCTLTQ